MEEETKSKSSEQNEHQGNSSEAADTSILSPSSANSTSHNNSSDDSTESKYLKIKQYAVRLKKSLSEKTDEIERLKEENARILAKGQNLSSIQQEFDKALDEIERFKSLEKSLQADLKSAVESNMKLKETHFENISQIQNLGSTVKKLTEDSVKLKEVEMELKVYKSRVTELESLLKETQSTVVDIKQEKRQTAILSLEITDYEKKLGDASEKLDQNKVEIENLIKSVEEKEAFLNLANNQLKEALEEIDELKRSVLNQKNELEASKEKTEFLQTEITKINERHAGTRSELRQITQELEDTKLNLSSELRIANEKKESLMLQLGQVEQKNSALEENRRLRESHISNLKLELSQLESEFSNYKVKAQAMLKSQKPQSSQGASTKESSDELENLQKIVQDFHSEISLLKSEMETIKLENESLSLERADLSVNLSKIKTNFAEKEMLLNKEISKLKQELKSKDIEMRTKLEETRAENAAILKGQLIQMESLKSAYEKKTNLLEEEIKTLKLSSSIQKKDSLSEENADLSYALNWKPSGEKRQVSQLLSIDTSEISFDQIPRGECEGSEDNGSHLHALLPSPSPSISLTNAPSKFPLSFEELLSESSGGERGVVVERNKELLRAQCQIKHLSGLLRESEANCERLGALSEALKEEIRRVERDGERKEHLKENTEYLKNIVLKFVMLNGEDERLQLVPVLKTILRLSPNEVVDLEGSIKGSSFANNSAVPKESHSSSWSSYLSNLTKI